MSDEIIQQQLIREFLKEVKNKLPGWLKDNRTELNDVLMELESHILDKAEEIAEGQEVQVEHVQHAIEAMGSPRSIASEYKKRGTPKIWISEELFPLYVKVLGIVIALIVGLNILGFIFNVLENGWSSINIYTEIWGILSGGLGALIIITVIFVALSVEGYLPEDFKKSKGKYQQKIIPTEKVDKMGQIEQQWKEKRLKGINPPLKRGELLAGGIIALLLGVAMLIQGPRATSFFGSEMSLWLRIAGIFTIVGALINLIQSMIDLTNYTAQRILIGLLVIKDVAFIPFLLQLTTVVLSVIVLNYQLIVPETIDPIRLGFNVITGFAIFGTIIGTISNVYKIITLQIKFEEYIRYAEI